MSNNMFDKIIIALISWFLALITFFLGQLFARINQRNNDRRNLIITITQNNAKLFSLIYQGSLNENNIDFSKLREELDKSNVIYILPSELKVHFKELYKIFFTEPNYYTNNKHLIHIYLVRIVKELDMYGVDTFGYK